MSKKTEAQRKQYRLSIGLQIIVVAIAAFLGVLAFTARWMRRAVPYMTSDELWKQRGVQIAQKVLTEERWNELMKGHFVFTAITSILCLAILIRFVMVCREIGADNSFSEANARGFRTMSRLSLAGVGLYAVKLVLYISRCVSADYGRAAVILAFVYGSMLAIFLIFAFLCRSLSKLVYNAYEVKLENELTI